MKRNLNPDWLFFSALFANVCVILTGRQFPFADMVNHLARFRLMDQYWFGQPPAYLRVDLIPTAYIGLDFVGVAAEHFFPTAVAMRIIAVLCMAALPMGAWLLLRAVNPDSRGWALVGVLLGFHWCYLFGFIHYSLGIGLALMWLAWWWPRREKREWHAVTVAAVLAGGVYLVHLAAAVVVLVVIWLDWGMAAVKFAREGTGSLLRRGPWLARAAIPLGVTVGIVTLWWVARLAAPSVYIPPFLEQVLYLPLWKKLTHLASPFYTFGPLQAVVMTAGYLACLGAFLIAMRRALRFNLFALSCGVLMLVYFALPVRFLGGYDVDMRLLVPAYILVFCLPGAGTLAAQARRWLWVPWAVCLVHALVVLGYARAIDRELADYDALLADIPPGGKPVVALVVEPSMGRLDPFRHYIHWYAIRTGGRTNNLFCGNWAGQYLGHFIQTRPVYEPDEFWSVRSWDSLDWNRLRADYCYVVQAGENDRAHSIIRQHGREISRHGKFTLYELDKPGEISEGLPVPPAEAPARLTGGTGG